MTLATQNDTARRVKSFAPIRFKAAGEDFDGEKLEEGEFVALASVFNNVDSYGERLVNGAFTETLAEWESSGDPVPVIWSHQWADPFAHMGQVKWARETEKGLLYKAAVDLDNEFAAQVYRLMKGRRIRQQSFGFDVLDAIEKKEDDRWIFEITRVKLFEVGPCLVGVNQETDLLGIKSTGGVTPNVRRTEHESGRGTGAADDGSSAAQDSDSKSFASAGATSASTLLKLKALELEMENE